MSADIKLGNDGSYIKLGDDSDETVIVEGLWLVSRTTDLILDHPDRRGKLADHGIPRRALVHNPSDRLPVNIRRRLSGRCTNRGGC